MKEFKRSVCNRARSLSFGAKYSKHFDKLQREKIIAPKDLKLETIDIMDQQGFLFPKDLKGWDQKKATSVVDEVCALHEIDCQALLKTGKGYTDAIKNSEERKEKWNKIRNYVLHLGFKIHLLEAVSDELRKVMSWVTANFSIQEKIDELPFTFCDFNDDDASFQAGSSPKEEAAWTAVKRGSKAKGKKSGAQQRIGNAFEALEKYDSDDPADSEEQMVTFGFKASGPPSSKTLERATSGEESESESEEVVITFGNFQDSDEESESNFFNDLIGLKAESNCNGLKEYINDYVGTRKTSFKEITKTILKKKKFRSFQRELYKFAVDKEDPDLLETLLSKGAIGWTSFIVGMYRVAFYTNNDSLFSALGELKYDFKVTTKDKKTGYSILQEAVKDGRGDIIESIKTRGFDVSGFSLDSTLVCEALDNHPKIFEVLLNAGILKESDKTIFFDSYVTLGSIEKNGGEPLVKLFQAFNVSEEDWDKTKELGYFFCYAVEFSLASLLEFFFSIVPFKKLMLYKTPLGTNALFFAARSGSKDILERLKLKCDEQECKIIDFNIETKARPSRGITSEIAAQQISNIGVYQSWIELGFPINNKAQDTMLRLYAKALQEDVGNDEVDFLRFLLESTDIDHRIFQTRKILEIEDGDVASIVQLIILSGSIDLIMILLNYHVISKPKVMIEIDFMREKIEDDRFLELKQGLNNIELPKETYKRRKTYALNFDVFEDI